MERASQNRLRQFIQTMAFIASFNDPSYNGKAGKQKRQRQGNYLNRITYSMIRRGVI